MAEWVALSDVAGSVLRAVQEQRSRSLDNPGRPQVAPSQTK